MNTLLVLIPVLPLVAAIITATMGARVLGAKSHWPVVGGLIGSFVCSVFLMIQVHAGNASAENDLVPVGFSHVVSLWTWTDVSAAIFQVAADATGTTRNFRIAVDLRADSLTSIMLVMVTFIGLFIAIYAAGYMQGDRGYWRFFSYVALFVFAMTMLVSVSNFLLLFVFWEAVGLCSYFLIGFWYEKPSAVAAGKKAFLVNRVGDFGFALAMFLIWTVYGTLNFHDVGDVPGVLGQLRLSTAGSHVGGVTGTAICLLLLLGACGKSAQFPLHVWLPDAMEGPTPVSALIHAATMVTAGVYMVARCTPLFIASPEAQLVVACIGAGTALMAAVIAMTQFDLKRVLAYSTISQLGYMFVALGTGTMAGITAGMFHLFTHAFFKALLFLGAGSVMHAMGDVIDMRKFSGLRKLMPITHGTFAIGCLALAGIFPFAGFWSKDAIVGAVHDQIHSLQSLEGTAAHNAAEATGIQSIIGHEVDAADATTASHLAGWSDQRVSRALRVYRYVYLMSLLTAFLTSLYTFRAYFMTFWGEYRIPDEAGHHAHESPLSMCLPLMVLAVFAVFVGGVLEYTHAFANFLGHTPSLSFVAMMETPQPGVFHMNVAILSTVIAVSGAGIAAYLQRGQRKESEWLKRFFDAQWLRRFVGKSWLAAWMNGRAVRRVFQTGQAVGLGWFVRIAVYMLAVALVTLHYLSPYKLSRGKFFIDELYDWLIVRPLRGLAIMSYAMDLFLIDGLVKFCSWIPRVCGDFIRQIHIGLVPFYALAMTLGLITLLVARAVWGG